VAHPLSSLLLTPEAVNAYNKLFVSLFAVKRVAHGLQTIWADAMRTDHRTPRLPRAKARTLYPACAVLSSMMYVVRNIQSWLHVDLIEAEWAVLSARVEEARARRDFEALRRAHTSWLAVLGRGVLLGATAANGAASPVAAAMHGTLRRCVRFTALVKAAGKGDATECSAQALDSIGRGFDRDAAKLLAAVERAGLAELAVRLDFCGRGFGSREAAL